jgi:hypothetical protein
MHISASSGEHSCTYLPGVANTHVHISSPGEHSCMYLPGLAYTHAQISSAWRIFMHVPAWSSVHQCTYIPIYSGVHSCTYFLTWRTSYHYLPCLAHNNAHCTVHTHALPANMSINANDPSLSHINTPKIIPPLLPTLINQLILPHRHFDNCGIILNHSIGLYMFLYEYPSYYYY